MPLTGKGEKILTNMKKEYGPKKGKEVFYASQNKGTITGTHEKRSSAADLAYAQGFMDKCAAQGVDPEELIKAGQFNLLNPIATGQALGRGARSFAGNIGGQVGNAVTPVTEPGGAGLRAQRHQREAMPRIGAGVQPQMPKTMPRPQPQGQGLVGLPGRAGV